MNRERIVHQGRVDSQTVMEGRETDVQEWEPGMRMKWQNLKKAGLKGIQLLASESVIFAEVESMPSPMVTAVDSQEISLIQFWK